MKKLMVMLAVFLVAPSAFAADPLENAVRRAVYREQGVSADFCVLPPAQQKAFDEMLPKALENMMKNKTFDFDVRQLGYALSSRAAYWWSIEKAVTGDDDVLSPQENRAILHAVWKLIPKEYNKNVISFVEYSNRFPVTDWGMFHSQCQYGLQLIYRGVKQIADNNPNYPYDALHALTH